ncbi:hypothetical protein PARPLA_00571 [Rhodobacteraceae bacterium THAF1]|uniref:DUF1365 domain-containing protein n=1 Tax=Palleronia sp. THAF1 TaxID=2587842 RepID=UPI000F3AC26E|nr:DUF1365 domain-containing protein [Palleronia sp. THAF1]QFU09866.1 hypothetical protein FIU81_14405 [Palleronia sp. THAF1]VDC17231.1 hypothetical protein PARPLA_00571 [Rhodobacteraceae bacterium THAF1]
MPRVEHIAGTTFHGRKDRIGNRFTYGIDYVLLDAEDDVTGPALFSRNGGNLLSLHDSDHGGAPKQGQGAAWVRQVLDDHQLAHIAHRIELLAQPRVLGHVFNPVSFWLIRDTEDDLRAVIAEVSNTFGDRHSYLCHRDDLAAITASDTLRAAKVFHVSPFQRIGGDYAFTFDIRPDRIAIRIDFSDGPDGLVATLTGKRAPMTTASAAKAMLRRPFGARRVLALIHWQALVLWWKGARYRQRPEAPDHEVSASPSGKAVMEPILSHHD